MQRNVTIHIVFLPTAPECPADRVCYSDHGVRQVIIDLADSGNPMRQPTTADSRSVIMNPCSHQDYSAERCIGPGISLSLSLSLSLFFLYIMVFCFKKMLQYTALDAVLVPP